MDKNYSIDYQHFFDLSLIYEDEKKRAKQLKSLNTIIVRYICKFTKIFHLYYYYYIIIVVVVVIKTVLLLY